MLFCCQPTAIQGKKKNVAPGSNDPARGVWGAVARQHECLWQGFAVVLPTKQPACTWLPTLPLTSSQRWFNRPCCCCSTDCTATLLRPLKEHTHTPLPLLPIKQNTHTPPSQLQTLLTATYHIAVKRALTCTSTLPHKA